MKKKKFLALAVATAIAGTLLLWATSATSDYMHYQDGTISICDPSSNGTKCITMQDKNLWATKAGTECSATDTWACGNHFQWWNNYWFPIWCFEDYCEDYYSDTHPDCIPRSDEYIHVWYYRDTFGFCNPILKAQYFTDWPHPELWWWENDSQENNWWFDEEKHAAINPEYRRWPCDTWYHVPSYWEWKKLAEYWSDINDVEIVNLYGYGDWHYSLSGAIWIRFQFQEDFKIPFAGYRSYGGDIRDVGVSASLSQTSLLSDMYDYVDGWEFASPFSILPYSVGHITDWFESYSVRCFKDSYLSFPLISTVNESTTTTIWWDIVTWLPTSMTVTENTVSVVEWEPVLWEVNITFSEWNHATFSHPVQIKVPVSDAGKAYVKVKHWWDSEYGFVWLTRNSNASCSNWEVVATSDRYNWETINVVDGYATIYSCSASSFIALGAENEWDSEIIVNIAEFNWWQNTCSGSNFIFENIVAWTNTGTHTLSWVFQCAFWNGRSSSTVTLQLSGDLVADGDRVISGSNLMMKNSEWTVSPVWLKFANTLIDTWRALTATQTLFQKTANLIWVASWVVEVQLTVPWWTPDGTYNWVLVLTY